MRSPKTFKYTISEKPGSEERADITREDGYDSLKVEVGSYSYGGGFTAWADLGDLLHGLGLTADDCRDALIRRVPKEDRPPILLGLLREKAWTEWCTTEGKDDALHGHYESPDPSPGGWRPEGWRGDEAEVDDAIASGWKQDPTL